MLDLVFRNLTRSRAVSERFFRDVLETVARVAKVKGPWEVSITLVGEKKIRDLNRTYRRKDAVTDVLSFPLGETPAKGYTGSGSGDIFICLPYARAKAARADMPLKRELAWLTAHGALHLLGYDHEKSLAEGKKMASLERTILATLDF